MAIRVPERDTPRRRTPDLRLVFFTSGTSGRCRRVEGFIAQVLQRRHNHNTFSVLSVSAESQPEVFERFGIEKVPTLVVIEDKKVKRSLELPGSCREIEQFLAPWLH